MSRLMAFTFNQRGRRCPHNERDAPGRSSSTPNTAVQHTRHSTRHILGRARLCLWYEPFSMYSTLPQPALNAVGSQMHAEHNTGTPTVQEALKVSATQLGHSDSTQLVAYSKSSIQVTCICKHVQHHHASPATQTLCMLPTLSQCALHCALSGAHSCLPCDTHHSERAAHPDSSC